MPPEANPNRVGPFLWGDPPQRDETWLSYLSRTAQYLGTTVGALVESVIGERKRTLTDLDIDKHPSTTLATKLRAAIPLDDGVGDWSRRDVRLCLAAKPTRTSYCPLCTKSDLEHGITPYFRWQWSTPFSFVCSTHESLLMTWQPSANAHKLRWPGAWLRVANGERPFVPAWLERDLGHIEELNAMEPSMQEVPAILDRIQRLLLSPLRTAEDDVEPRMQPALKRWLLDFAQLVVAACKESDLPPLADRLRPDITPEWLLGPWRARHQRREFTNALRPLLASRDLAWRRTVFWLAGKLMFGSNHPVPTSLGSFPAGAWDGLWEEWVVGKVDPEIAFRASDLGRYLAQFKAHAERNEV